MLLVFNPQEPKKKKGKKSTGKKGGGGGGAARGRRARGKKAAGKVTVLSKVQSCVLFIELLRVNSVKGAWRLSVAAKIVPFARPPWSCSRLVIFPPVSAFALGLVKTSVFGETTKVPVLKQDRQGLPLMDGVVTFVLECAAVDLHTYLPFLAETPACLAYIQPYLDGVSAAFWCCCAFGFCSQPAPKPSRRSSREKPKVVYDEDAMDVDLGLLEDADGNKKGQVRGGSSRGWGKDGGGGRINDSRGGGGGGC